MKSDITLTDMYNTFQWESRSVCWKRLFRRPNLSCHTLSGIKNKRPHTDCGISTVTHTNTCVSHLILDLLPLLGFLELLQRRLPPHLLLLLPSGARLGQTTGVASIVWGWQQQQQERTGQFGLQRCLSHWWHICRESFKQRMRTTLTLLLFISALLTLFTTLWRFVKVSLLFLQQIRGLVHVYISHTAPRKPQWRQSQVRR